MGDVYLEEQKKYEGVLINLINQLHMLAPHQEYDAHEDPRFTGENAEPEVSGAIGNAAFKHIFSAASIQSTHTNAKIDGLAHIFMQKAANSNIEPKNRALSGQFNGANSNHQKVLAYIHDLPVRLGLERLIAYYERKIYSLRKQSFSYGLELAL